MGLRPGNDNYRVDCLVRQEFLVGFIHSRDAESRRRQSPKLRAQLGQGHHSAAWQIDVVGDVGDLAHHAGAHESDSQRLGAVSHVCD
jgi:hypothetical protein